MNVRAKMIVREIRRHAYSPTSATIILHCEYDPSIPEDQRFYDATPTGHVEMYINNPAVIEEMQLGNAYYLNFTPVPED